MKDAARLVMQVRSASVIRQLRSAKVGFEPGGESLLHLLQFAGEEMIRPWDHDQIGRWRRTGHHGFHPGLGPVLIRVAADKELGLAQPERKL